MPHLFVVLKDARQGSVERVRTAITGLAEQGDVVHLAYVLLQPVAHLQQQNEVKAKLEAKLQPVFTCKPGVSVVLHVLPAVHPYSSFAEPAVTKARALCRKAAALQCRVMVIGGYASKLRNAALPAFLVGHSTSHWIMQFSSLPIYLMNGGQLIPSLNPAVPAVPAVPQYTAYGSVLDAGQIHLVSAAA